jgi:hypothetical protein
MKAVETTWFELWWIEQKVEPKVETKICSFTHHTTLCIQQATAFEQLFAPTTIYRSVD